MLDFAKKGSVVIMKGNLSYLNVLKSLSLVEL